MNSVGGFSDNAVPAGIRWIGVKYGVFGAPSFLGAMDPIFSKRDNRNLIIQLRLQISTQGARNKRKTDTRPYARCLPVNIYLITEIVQ